MALHVDVSKLMQGELGSWLDERQSMRTEAKNKAHWRWALSAVVVILLFALLWFVTNWDAEIERAVGAGAAFGGYVWGFVPIYQAKREIKIGVNSAIARELGIEYQAFVSPGDELNLAMRYGLFKPFEHRKLEDQWFGVVEGHSFRLYEAHLETKKTWKNQKSANSHRKTVFRGVIIQLEFGRKFRSTTLLQRAGKHKKWFGIGGRADHAHFDGHRLEYVDQVHPAFEDAFEVWSDDQVEARVLVDPSYVENLIEIERAFKGAAVRAIFNKGEVVIAIETKKNLFESGHINSAGDRERAEKTAKQFASLAKLALAFNKVERGQGLGG